MDASIKYYIETQPQYRETLEFLQSIFDFQAELVEKIKPGRKNFEQAEVIELWRAQKPLFTGKMYPVDPLLFRETLPNLQPLLSSDKAMQEALNRLLASDLLAPANVETFLNNLNTTGETYIQQLADDLAIAADALAFLLQTVLSPFFEKAAQPYRKWLEIAPWRSGTCPICGSEPVMARLTRDEGQRILTCSLCHTEWAFDRVRCPFCEDEASSELNYFTLDDDSAHRVDCCNQCQRYLKTVDERAVNYPINLLVENIITAQLDTIATEQGYLF